MSDEVSQLVKETARSILLHLRSKPHGASKAELGASAGVSAPSIQRALTWLRDECDSPLAFDRGAGKWQLNDPHFSLPLSDPEAEDLAAVMFAEALLAPVADGEITQRVRRLAEQMDAEIRNRTDAPPDAPGTRPGALVATLTTASTTDPRVLAALLGAVGRQAVEIAYSSPWSAEPVGRRYRVEPWQLRMHDGSIYMRAWSRDHREARVFAVAHIDEARLLHDDPLQATVPQVSEIWGDADPAFGIDTDRPDSATLVIRGPVARWVHRQSWDAGQVDRWLTDKELLERRLPYRSCRELARRLLSLGDAIESIEPPALRQAVQDHARSLAERNLTPSS
jgi:predicted DNA-binding transcriptional regulator YafY